MISSYSNSKSSSSENNSNNDKMEFDTIYMHNDRMNNLKYKGEDKKCHSAIIKSELENSLDKKNLSFDNTEKKESLKKNIATSTERIFLKINKNQKNERINHQKTQEIKVILLLK